MDKKPLTKRQQEVLDYVQDYTAQQGFSPSIREICTHFNISSTRGAHRHLEVLEKKGYLERKSTARSIKIIKDISDKIQEFSNKVINMPLVGHVAAGSPILAEENIEDVIPISADFARNIHNGFLLRVKGDSMIGDGILNGDMVIVAPQPDATNGEIVVALVGDEATVKRFFKERKSIRLQPSNSRYKPIRVDRDFRIVGRVIGVVRKY